MADTRPTTDDPAFLLEAARVFNAAGPDYAVVAAALAEMARRKAGKNGVDKDTADAIAGDTSALRLAIRLPGGYREALAILQTRIGEPGTIPDRNEKDLQDTRIRLYLLRALASGQKYNDRKRKNQLPPDSPDLQKLRAGISADITFVFEKRPGWAPMNEAFWKPPKGVSPKDREDDLAEVYNDDSTFSAFVDSKTANNG